MRIERVTAAARRLARGAVPRNRGEDGFTLVEMLVASMMTIVLLGAIGSMVVSAMRDQPQISKRSQEISEARWVLERLTREIRQGAVVNKASGSSVSFQTYVRHATCGGSGTLAEGSPAIKCEITYTCTTTSCKRIEAAPGVYTGTETTIFSGIDSSEVFCYVAGAAASPSSCGAAPENPAKATYVGVKLHFPNPNGSSGGGMTISDGATLTNATLID